MTNQALYHAAGIGHLHQNVHVAEHNMGEDAACRAGARRQAGAGPRHHRTTTRTVWRDASADVHDQARKIALMDFLSNNLDRHSRQPPRQDEAHRRSTASTTRRMGEPWAHTAPGRRREAARHRPRPQLPVPEHRAQVQAGRSASEQPKDPAAIASPTTSAPAAINNATSLVDERPFYDAKTGKVNRAGAQEASVKAWQPTVDWWEQVGPQVRKAFEQRLGQIKDPEVQAHLRRNFEARADYLDDFANMGLGAHGSDWYNSPVPVYRPGELTDSEREEQAWRARSPVAAEE
jgi:hypothetical protein